MSESNQYKTAESVSPKHPDKLCDQVSDAILDAYLAIDSKARVAVDVAGGHGKLFITGEASLPTTAIDIAGIVERIVGDIDWQENIALQSPEIARGVDSGGAGDQGIMIGYASSETDEMLPLEVVLSRRLNQHLYKQWPYDGKTQITTRGEQIVGVVASFQHAPTDQLQVAVEQWLKDYDVSTELRLHVNPSGDWQIGGFEADAGLTGRKLAVDNYGPTVPIGGGAFSGKDPSKVDRSAAYMARRIAVDYLRQRQAREVVVRLSYAIGIAEPLEATVLLDGVAENVVGYELTPNGIINSLDLTKAKYEVTAQYGHFGHQFVWEK